MLNSEHRMSGSGRMIRIACAVTMTVAIGAGLTGCAKHYEITDINTGQTYYTKKYKKHGGAVQFKSERSGNRMNLQNTEIEKISKKSYKDATSNR